MELSPEADKTRRGKANGWSSINERKGKKRS